MAISRTSYADRIGPPGALEIPDPGDDLDRLARLLFGMATVLLRRKGRFFPFGGVIWADNGVEQLMAAPVAPKVKPPADLLDALVTELRAEAAKGRLRAGGTCIDVRQNPEQGDVMRADLEDRTGRTKLVLLGYQRRFPRRLVVLPEPVERVGVTRLFTP